MRYALLLGFCVLAASNPLVAGPVRPGDQAQMQSGAGHDESAVRQKVEDFLKRLGNRDVDSLVADFAPKALIIVTRQRENSFVNSIQTLDDFIAALKQSVASKAPTFQEPLSNVRVTIDSGHLAYLRADFEVVRDGKVLSRGVDQFTLIREPDGWKIAVVAYTSLPVGQ